eukprot:8443887-Ditylum_brightwellii.AAC.1
MQSSTTKANTKHLEMALDVHNNDSNKSNMEDTDEEAEDDETFDSTTSESNSNNQFHCLLTDFPHNKDTILHLISAGYTTKNIHLYLTMAAKTTQATE